MAIGALTATWLPAACGSDGEASPATTAPGTDAAAYCTAQGGTVETRQAYWGTNNDQSQWLSLAGRLTLCRFVADDQSRIYIDVASLADEEPSLAAAAYLAKLPLPNSGGANPAAVDCAALDGTSAFGSSSAAGGGWVDLDDPAFTVVNPCLFADGSAIDEWGIAYYSDGTIRGADLAPLFRSDPAAVTALFPPAS